jgi:hypothetical protein
MNDPRRSGQARDTAIGLCADCAHARVVRSARGSEFYLCELSFADRRFPRYPPLPVLRCEGYRRLDPTEPC